MTLLEAVNFILPRINEHQVTSLGARSPTLQILLQSIEDFKVQILVKGWWFNTQRNYLANPDVSGHIYAGSTALMVSAVERSGVALVGGRLKDMVSYTDVFTEAVKLDVVHNVDFEALPVSMQNWVKYAVLIDQYNTDVGATADMAEWEKQRRSAEQSVLSEHLLNNKYNTRMRLGYMRMRRAMRGV